MKTIDIIDIQTFPQLKNITALYWLLYKQNTIKMKNVNYILAVILIVLWVIGFFTHFGGHSIHLLLVGAFTLILINVINDDSTNSPEQNINH